MGKAKDVLYFRNMFVMVTPVHKCNWLRGSIFIETDIGAVYQRTKPLEAMDEMWQRAMEAYHLSRTFEVSGLLGVVKSDYEPTFRLDVTTQMPKLSQMRNAWMCARKHLFVTTDQGEGNMRIDRVNDKDAVDKLQLIAGW